jgi:hypothetical protein
MESTYQAVTPTMDPAVRQERLNQAIAAELARGGRIESQTGSSAVVVRGNRVNHILHLLLTLITLGIWVIVWLIISASGGERRRIINADPYGNVSTQDVPRGLNPALIVLGIVVLLWIVGVLSR